MTYDQYVKWRDANINYHDLGYINLRSWMKGCRHEMLKSRKEANDEPEGKKA